MMVNLDFIPVETAKVFKIISGENFMNRYTLVGGTALSLQLGHRQSEDLDFIFDGEQIPVLSIKRKISKLFPDYRILREEQGFQLDFLVLNKVKLTFFSTGAVLIPFLVKERSFIFNKTNIAEIETIAVLKMSSIAQRCTIRDYYDLFFIVKYEIPLEQIFSLCKKLLPHLSSITYTETIIYIRDIAEDSISDHLNPKEMITKKQIADFFCNELKKIYSGGKTL